MAKNEMSVQTDNELEKDAEHPLGRITHISTVTHAWRGMLKFVTPNYFVFETGTAQLVGDTGDINEYAKNYKSSQEQSTPLNGVIRVPRASVCWIHTVE